MLWVSSDARPRPRLTDSYHGAVWHVMYTHTQTRTLRMYTPAARSRNTVHTQNRLKPRLYIPPGSWHCTQSSSHGIPGDINTHTQTHTQMEGAGVRSLCPWCAVATNDEQASPHLLLHTKGLLVFQPRHVLRFETRTKKSLRGLLRKGTSFFFISHRTNNSGTPKFYQFDHSWF